MKDQDSQPPVSGAATLVRGGVGGLLMGLANLVPGISGGTMLLATGIYTQFIESIADITTFRFRMRSIFTLATVGVAAGLAIGLLSGVVKSLVHEHTWIMYSIFIGLTLGGVPVVWRLARRATPALVFGAVLGFGAMAAMLVFKPHDTGGSNTALLFVAGLAGASAMILPGVSGAYLLLVLGQYYPILGAIQKFKEALLGQGDGLSESLGVIIPVGLGVVAGIVGVSNLVRWALTKHRMLTLGILLGLLLGSVLGIYPFQAPLAVESHEFARFDPTGGQIAAAIGLVLLGFGITTLIDRLGGEEPGVEVVGNTPLDSAEE